VAEPAQNRRNIREGLLAGLVAATVSGLPSTAFSLWRDEDPLEASRAAGQLLEKPTLTRALAVHLIISLGWGVVLSQVLGPRHLRTSATMAGGAIAALDLGLIGRRIPAIHSLKVGPQVADHLAYGMSVGFVLARFDARRRQSVAILA
jgi:hypothetical protein